MKLLLQYIIIVFFFSGCSREENNETYIDFVINGTPVFISDISPMFIDDLNPGLSQVVDPLGCSTRSNFLESIFEINGAPENFLWRFSDIQIEQLGCAINADNLDQLIVVGNEFIFLNSSNDCSNNTGIGEANTIIFNIGDGVTSRSDFWCQPSDSFFEITSVNQLHVEEDLSSATYPIIMESRFKFATFKYATEVPDFNISGKMKIRIDINASL